MTPATSAALEQSIQHWKQNVETVENGNLDIPVGWRNCALCRKIVQQRLPTWDCDGCPVEKRTGVSGCANTPYTAVMEALEHEDAEKILAACKAELAFLESLREDK